MGEVKTKTVIDEKGRTHAYEWINQIPLNGNKDTVMVNFFQYEMITENKQGEPKTVDYYLYRKFLVQKAFPIGGSI